MVVVGKINVVVALYSFKIHEAVLKNKIESRVDVGSMYLWMEKYIENTSWKVLAYSIYARVVDVSEIERVSTSNE